LKQDPPFFIMPNFNLITDPWIPVRWLDPSRREPLVGLDRLFSEAEAIADLSANPAERVSLMRLLVCIAQAALGAPPHRQAWAGFGDDLVTTVPEYLDRPEIRERFELFGDGARFLQANIPPKAEPVPASKLFPHLASGNNPTIFDHAGGTTRAVPPARLALGLLVFQCFYPLYGAGYKGKGPCVDSNMLHLLLRGDTLAKAILRNCLDEETVRTQFPRGVGRPHWELDEKDKSFAANASETYLGRLVPRHRNLRLTDDGTGFSLVTESIVYPTFDAAIEPTATVVVRKKGSDSFRALLPARLERAAWRDLHLICAMRVAEGETQGAAPLVLQSHLAEITGSDLPVALVWTGALVTDLKAKILDTVESSYTISARMLQTYDGQRDYEAGVEYAEAMSKRLYGAVKTYATSMKNESAPVDFAQRHYWHALDRDASVLLGLVADPDAMAGREFGKWSEGKPDRWTAIVRAALTSAYNAACPRQNARQYEAYAAGLRVLFPKPAKAKKIARSNPVCPSTQPS